MKAWTDYPFVWLGDTSGEPAPIREVEVLSYDGNKYCRIRVADGEDEIKAGYLYVAPGRCGEVESVNLSSLDGLASNAKGQGSAACGAYPAPTGCASGGEER